MNHGIIITLFLICVSQTYPAFCTIQFCESSIGSCVNFTVSGCKSDDAECILRHGRPVDIGISFKPSQDVDEVQADVKGVIAGLPVPFPLPNPDGCKDCGLKCPLTKDGIYSYHTSLPIKKAYPKISLKVIWKLKNGNGVICCAEIPSRISS